MAYHLMSFHSCPWQHPLHLLGFENDLKKKKKPTSWFIDFLVLHWKYLHPWQLSVPELNRSALRITEEQRHQIKETARFILLKDEAEEPFYLLSQYGSSMAGWLEGLCLVGPIAMHVLSVKDLQNFFFVFKVKKNASQILWVHFCCFLPTITVFESMFFKRLSKLRTICTYNAYTMMLGRFGRITDLY